MTLNINGYGGAYDEILKETVAKPLKEKYGLDVVYQPGGSGSGAATARLLASKDDPPFDLFNSSWTWASPSSRAASA